eukprot:1143493-Pelagomonas_calceolata.AAC.1
MALERAGSVDCSVSCGLSDTHGEEMRAGNRGELQLLIHPIRESILMLPSETLMYLDHWNSFSAVALLPLPCFVVHLCLTEFYFKTDSRRGIFVVPHFVGHFCCPATALGRWVLATLASFLETDGFSAHVYRSMLVMI